MSNGLKDGLCNCSKNYTSSNTRKGSLDSFSDMFSSDPKQAQGLYPRRTKFDSAKIIVPTVEHTFNGALRFDNDKPELHNIHPIAWNTTLRANKDKLSETILDLNNRMDLFFYNDIDILGDGWENLSVSNILEMTKVLEFGAKKYASLNYAKGMKYSRVINSFRRHILKIIEGEVNDAESGLTHEGHIICNYMFMFTYVTSNVDAEFDDRTILSPKETK